MDVVARRNYGVVDARYSNDRGGNICDESIVKFVRSRGIWICGVHGSPGTSQQFHPSFVLSGRTSLADALRTCKCRARRQRRDGHCRSHTFRVHVVALALARIAASLTSHMLHTTCREGVASAR